MNSQPLLKRRTLLAGATAGAAASALPRFAIAQDKPLKIGYITALSGPRAPFGVADEWQLARIRALLKDGLAVAGGKRLAVEIVVKDNQSDPNRSLQVASDLVLRDKVDLMLVQDGDASTPAGQLCDVHGIPMVSTMSPWQAFLFARNGDVRKGFPFSFHFFWGADDVLRTFVSMWSGVATNKQVGTLYIDNPPGQAFADLVARACCTARATRRLRAASSRSAPTTSRTRSPPSRTRRRRSPRASCSKATSRPSGSRPSRPASGPRW
jgi:branched-chain amino acid transport system substrate-binding protein